MSTYVPLHVHSSFSPKWGVRSLEEICAAAKAMGWTRLALTDRNGLYGLPHFLDAVRAGRSSAPRPTGEGRGPSFWPATRQGTPTSVAS